MACNGLTEAYDLVFTFIFPCFQDAFDQVIKPAGHLHLPNPSNCIDAFTEATELLWKRFYFPSALTLIPAIQCFNIMPGNPKQTKLNLALSPDSGSLRLRRIVFASE
jgi:hypothetical protein